MAIIKEYLHEMATLNYADYYERNKQRIRDACAREYKRLQKTDWIDTDQYIEPDAVGRIMANMYHADVWATVAMALKLTADDDVREDLYAAMQGLKRTVTKEQQ